MVSLRGRARRLIRLPGGAAMGADGVEFGARAYGVHGEQAATAIVEQIRSWDQRARSASAPTFCLLAYRQ